MPRPEGANLDLGFRPTRHLRDLPNRIVLTMEQRQNELILGSEPFQDSRDDLCCLLPLLLQMVNLKGGPGHLHLKVGVLVFCEVCQQRLPTLFASTQLIIAIIDGNPGNPLLEGRTSTILLQGEVGFREGLLDNIFDRLR